MVYVEFTSHLTRHVACPPQLVDAGSLKEALQRVFAGNPALRGYILDDQGRIRQHVAVFVNQQLLRDRVAWDIPLPPDSKVYVMQALSGG